MEIVTGSERVSHQFVSPIVSLGSSSKKAAKRSIEEPTEAARFFDVLVRPLPDYCSRLHDSSGILKE